MVRKLRSDNVNASQDTPDDTFATVDDGSDDEHIVVTRPEDARDPEAEADFDRELAKMMAESAETRKHERRPMFDVALPMRRVAARDTGPSTPLDEEDAVDRNEGDTTAGIVKFSLLSKRGNRQQVRRLCRLSALLTDVVIPFPDAFDRHASRLELRNCHAYTTGGSPGRTTAYQSSRT